MPTCFFLILFSSFFFLFSHSFNSKLNHCYVLLLYNSSMLMSHCHYNVMQEHQLVNLIITFSNFIVTMMKYFFKFHFSCFQEPLTPYYFLLLNFIFFHYYLAKAGLFISYCFFLVMFIPALVQFHYINSITFLL